MTIRFGNNHIFYLSPIGEAIQQKNDEKALGLLKSGHLVLSEENGHGTLQQIIRHCPNPKLIEAVIEKLPAEKINAIDSTGDTALMTAAKCRNIVAVNLLVAAKADVNLPDKFQQTPLHQALNRTYPNQVPKSTVLGTVKCLLKHGASMEILDTFKKTALQAYISIDFCDPEVISLLVSAGDKPPYADVLKRSPGHRRILNAAIQTGLERRRKAVSTALTSQPFPLELLNLINKYEGSI
ncbi:MAG TPA: ankyrin repeat domain-containing protein [Chlamydiales bacterium]|jgi:ankyrin repeat protein|nr:ankyrin repeat domain-containing protein [Chlamydiales bacterium]